MENNTLNNEPAMSNYPIQEGSPYFMGDEALIKFSSSEEGYGKNTFWLVDKDNHTVRPFESIMSLDAVFGEELEEALKNVVIVSQPNVDEEGEINDGVLDGFTILGPEYAIKEDGSTKELHFSTHQLKSRYGKPINEKAENDTADALDRFISMLKTKEADTGIPKDYLEEIKDDEKLMAFYVSSIAYGKYSLKDIYLDIIQCFKNSKE